MITYDIITTNNATGEQTRHLITAWSMIEATFIADNRVKEQAHSTQVVDAYRTLYSVRKGIMTELIEPIHWYRLSFTTIDKAIDYLINERLIPDNSFYYEDDIKDGETALPIWCTIDGEDEFTGYTIDFLRLVEDINFLKNSEGTEDAEYWRE